MISLFGDILIDTTQVYIYSYEQNIIVCNRWSRLVSSLDTLVAFILFME